MSMTEKMAMSVMIGFSHLFVHEGKMTQNWAPRMIPVGELGSRPIVLATGIRQEDLASAKIDAKLVSYDALPGALQTLQAAVDRYVPGRETAESWQQCFKQFREMHPGPVEDQFQAFTALLYARTKLPADSKGHLLVSSVHTYLKYVCSGESFKLRFQDCFRAIETQAGSVGTTHVAPSINEEQLPRILGYIADVKNDPVDRMGLWLQCHGGGRPIDAARIRQNGLDFTTNSSEITDHIRGIIWRWAKNISKPGQAKYSPTLKEVLAEFGPPPVDKKSWLEMCKKSDYPLEAYTSSRVNLLLKEIYKDSSPAPTSTSLRDLCHQVLAKKYDCNAEAMIKHTPHRSTKSMQGNYIANRPKSVSARVAHGARNTAARRKTTRAPKKSAKRSK